MNKLKLYNSFSKYTFCLIYLVIVAGGVVRMTESGMGCPDWPKCFGYWIPPTDISELPLNYKEIYADRGYDKLNFNVFNTWTEYANRLIGAIAGFATLILLFISFTTKKKELILFSAVLVFLMGFQGWMGSLVVASVLSPIKITIHMLIALLILALVLFLQKISTSSKPIFTNPLLYKLLIISLIISIIQIVLGTQVREGVDLLLKDISKSEIITSSIPIFYTHRLVAWFVLISNLLLIYIARDIKDASFHIYIISIVLFCLLGTGILMTYFAFPGLAQLLHLVCAVTLFLIQIDMLFKYHYYSIE